MLHFFAQICPLQKQQNFKNKSFILSNDQNLILEDFVFNQKIEKS